MDGSTIVDIVWGVGLILLIAVVVFAKRRRRRLGAGATGATYEWETRDRRQAIELIAEQRAEARDPERADGNLPDLEKPAPRR